MRARPLSPESEKPVTESTPEGRFHESRRIVNMMCAVRPNETADGCHVRLLQVVSIFLLNDYFPFS